MVDMRRLLVATVIGLNSWAFTSVVSLGKFGKIAFRPPRLPLLILVFILIDVSLGLGYIINEIVERPSVKLTMLLDLDNESNLPTWYSSIQWFCVAIMLGLFAHSNFWLAQRRSWLLPVLPLVFLALSVDEVARIHEWIGERSEILLPGGSRANTPLPETGIWMFVVGVPFLAAFVWLISSLRMYFQDTPNALIKVFAGMLITLSGAIGFETLTNLVVPGSMYGILQVFLEEFCEMLGGTIVLWGSYELLLAHGFAYSLGSVHFESPAQQSSRYQPSRDKTKRKHFVPNRRSQVT